MDPVTSGGARRRPFSSWRTPYREGNSSLGFFCDLVVEARHRSPTVYLKEIGLDARTIDPRAVLSSLLLLPLNDAVKEELDRASASVADDGVFLSGQPLRRRQWSIARRRWCPGCLAESPHHRTWWDVVPYTVCHLHGCPIEDSDADGLPLEWWWPDMAESPRGHVLAREMPRLAHLPTTLSSYVVGRLGYSDPVAAPLLDDATLGDALDFVVTVGRILGWHSVIGARASDFAAENTRRAFELCVGGIEPLIGAVHQVLVENVTPEQRSRGMSCYGWAQHTGTKWRDARLKSQLRLILRDALTRAQFAGKKFASEPIETTAGSEPAGLVGPMVRSLYVGLFELSKRLGLDRRGVLGVAERIGVMPERTWHRGRLSFDEAAVDAITSALGNLTTHVDAATALRLKPSALSKLVEAGTLSPLVNVSRGEAQGRRYFRNDIERVRIEIEAGRDVPGFDPAFLQPTPARFAMLSMPSHEEAPNARLVGMTRAEVEAELGVLAGTVHELERRELLRRVPNAVKGKPELIERASVLAVREKLASARVYRGVAKTSTAGVVTLLEFYGVEPVVPPTGDSRVTPMFDRGEVRRALGLDHDPDVPPVDRVNDLWSELYHRLAVACPRLKCPFRMPADEFTVTTANRKVIFRIRIDRAATTVQVAATVSQKRSARRWRVFEANRAAILGVSPVVSWEEWMQGAEGTVTLTRVEDVPATAIAIERLTRLLGVRAVAPKRSVDGTG